MIGNVSSPTVQTGPRHDVLTRSSDFSPANAAGADAALLERAERGAPLTPVEQGQIARMFDQGGAAAAGAVAAGVAGAAAAAGAGAGAVIGAAAGAAVGAAVGSAAAGAAEGPKVRTAADFTITGANKQDIADLNAALKYLSKSPTAQALLDKLPAGSKLEIVHDGGDQYDPNNQTISWDPRSGLAVSSGKGTQSAAMGLIHEVDHQVAGLANPKPTGDGYHNTEEKRVITGSEAKIAKDLHEPIRTDHGGSTVVMKSSTAHTHVK